MPQVRLKRKFEAEQWITTNTALIVDWVRRGGTASIRWYPYYKEDDNGTAVPRWMRIPEHLVIVDEGGVCVVTSHMWIFRDEQGHHHAISDAEFKSVFELTP